MLRLMPERRQDHLLKVAEETISLMNIGTDGNTTLAKLAQDNNMNEHEIDLVTHAVNNSRQLAHIQESDPADRETAIPLLDAKKVKDIAAQPVTSADLNTGERYGTLDEPADDTNAKLDAPDAIGIKDEITKAAGYHDTPVEDHLSILRNAWGVAGDIPKYAEHVTEFAWADVQRAEHAAGEQRICQMKAAQAVYDTLDEISTFFRSLGAPKFAAVEHAALADGFDPELLNLAYSASNLDAIGGERAQGKFATGTVRVPAHVFAGLQLIRKLAACTDAAASAGTVFTKAAAENSEYGSRLGEVNPFHDLVTTGKDGVTVNPFDVPQGRDVVSDITGLDQASPETSVHDFLGSSAEGDDAAAYAQGVERSFQGATGANSARARLEQAMSDKYIGGFETPDVIEAYNAALSVNPNFSSSELKAFMRQHLATEGGVPLDMQLRARPSGHGDS